MEQIKSFNKITDAKLQIEKLQKQIASLNDDLVSIQQQKFHSTEMIVKKFPIYMKKLMIYRNFRKNMKILFITLRKDYLLNISNLKERSKQILQLQQEVKPRQIIYLQQNIHMTTLVFCRLTKVKVTTMTLT